MELEKTNIFLSNIQYGYSTSKQEHSHKINETR